MKGKQCCGNCWFWQRFVLSERTPPDGLCLRNPPSVQVGPGGFTRPETTGTAWCGEWQAENPDTADAVLLAMARAVLTGDMTAARAMADRLAELPE